VVEQSRRRHRFYWAATACVVILVGGSVALLVVHFSGRANGRVSDREEWSDTRTKMESALGISWRQLMDLDGLNTRFEERPIVFWLQLMVSGDAPYRKLAAKNAWYMWFGASRAGKITINEIKHTHAEEDAARASVLVGTVTARAALMVPYLAMALTDPEMEVRQLAAETLEAIGPEAVWLSERLATMAITDSSSVVRRSAARALCRASGHVRESVIALLAVLKEYGPECLEDIVTDIVALGEEDDVVLPLLESMQGQMVGSGRRAIEAAKSRLAKD